MKRFLALMLCVLLAAACFAGCGGDGSSSSQQSSSSSSSSESSASDSGTADSSETSADTSSGGSGDYDYTGEPVTIEFFETKTENVEIYEKLVAKFMEEYPNITINAAVSADATKVLTTRISTGDVPDLVNIYPRSMNYVVMQEAGAFMPLNGESFLDKVNQQFIDICTLDDGNIYGLPVTTNAFGLYVNTKIFEDNNLEIPTTFDEMFEVAEALKAKGIQPFSCADKDTGNIQQWFERIWAGAVNHSYKEFCDKVKAGEASFADDPDFRKYCEYILKIREYAQADNLGYAIADTRTQFATEECAMFIDISSSASVLLDINPDLQFKVVAIPTISEEVSTTSGTPDTCLAISATTEAPDACKTFLNWFVQQDTAQEYSDADMNPTLLKEVDFSMPELKDIADMIMEDRFTLAPSAIFGASIRSAVQMEVQTMIMEKDIDAFCAKMDEIIKNEYEG